MSGEIINYSNLVNYYHSASWQQGSTQDADVTWYVSGCCQKVEVWVDTVLFRSNWVNLTAYYYNGSSWVQAYAPRDDEGYTIYGRGGTSKTTTFYHNLSTQGSTSGDQKMYHIWKYVAQMRGADGSAHGGIRVYSGDAGFMTQAEYNTYFQNNKIKCIPLLLGTTDTYTDISAPERMRPSERRGIKISGSYRNLVGYTPID